MPVLFTVVSLVPATYFKNQQILAQLIFKVTKTAIGNKIQVMFTEAIQNIDLFLGPWSGSAPTGEKKRTFRKKVKMLAYNCKIRIRHRKNKTRKLAINQKHYIHYAFYYSQQHYEENISFRGQLWLLGNLSNVLQ